MVLVELLGPLTVVGPDGSATVTSARQASVLTALALRPGRAVRVDELVDFVWPQDPPASARNTLQVHVHAVRRLLTRVGPVDGPELLRHEMSSYRLDLTTQDTDVGRLEHLVSLGAVALTAGRAEAALADFDGALALWRGEPFAGLPESGPLQATRAGIEAARAAAMEGRLDALLALGRYESALAGAEDLVAAHPFRETSWSRLIVVLYRAGRPYDALTAFRRARDTLAEELGLDPGPELIALEAAVLRHDPALLGAGTPLPDRGAEAPTPTGLPWYPNPTVGRAQEVEQLAERLRAPSIRLVTVLGPGGVGKTRLATEVAQQVVGAPFDAVVFVDLTQLAATPDLAEGIARLILASGGVRAADSLAAAVHGQAVLVLLDNAEQLAASLAPAVATMLRDCPGLKFLVTSRAALSVQAEHRYVLAPLDGDAAFTLFADRARASSRDFTPDADTRALVQELCERLDHLPLALELAAARLRIFPLAVLRQRLETDLLLLSGSRDSPDRHRSLGDTIRWSAQLLTPAAAGLLARISVFRGGFTLAAAARVTGADELDTLDALTELIDSSLLTTSWSAGLLPVNAPVRFGLLETVRQYATTTLAGSGEGAQVHRAHADYFADHLRTQSATADVYDLAGRIRPELPNLVAAVDHLLGVAPDHAADLLIGGARALLRGVAGAGMADWCDRVLVALALTSTRRPELLGLRGVLAYRAIEYELAGRYLREALAAQGMSAQPSYLEVFTHLYLGALLAEQNDPRAQQAAADTIEAARRNGDPSVINAALGTAGYVARLGGDVPLAVDYGRRSVAAARELGDPIGLCDRLAELATTLLLDDQPGAALPIAEEAVELSRRTESPLNLFASYAALGRTMVRLGRPDEAVAAFVQSILADIRSGNPSTELGWLAAALAPTDPVLAARALGAAYSVFDQSQDIEDLPPDVVLRPLRDALSDYADEVEAGRIDGWSQIVEWVLQANGPADE